MLLQATHLDTIIQLLSIAKTQLLIYYSSLYIFNNSHIIVQQTKTSHMNLILRFVRKLDTVTLAQLCKVWLENNSHTVIHCQFRDKFQKTFRHLFNSRSINMITIFLSIRATAPFHSASPIIVNRSHSLSG